MRLIDKLLTNNGSVARSDPMYRKVGLLNTLLIGVMIACSIFFVIDIVLFRMYRAAAVNAAGVILSILAMLYFMKTKRYEPVAYLSIGALILCQICYFQIAQNQYYALIWICIVPPIAYFLLHRGAARIVTLLFCAYMLFFAIFNMSGWSPAVFNSQSVFNILGAMLCLLFMVSYYEKTREDVWKELNAAIHQLDESKEDLRLILDSSADAIYGIDRDGNCTFCNKSCLNLLGYKDETQILGKNTHRLMLHTHADGSEYPVEQCRIFRAFTHGESTHSESEVFWRADGTSFAAEYFSHPKIKDGEIVGAVITFMDISERKKREAEIRYLSDYDPLTGLQNRRRYEETRALTDTPENLPLSVIVADINWLKMTNDVFGHDAGDELIRKTSDILKKVCRPSDTIARVGGDEFTILLPRTSVEDASNILRNIKTQIAGSRVAAIKCSVSAGIATKTSIEQTLDEVMLDAESAMYKDKTMNRKSENRQMLDTLVEALHTKYPREKQHASSVSHLCAALGAALKLSGTELEKLKQAAALHDIGKIVLDESVIQKDQLTEEEAAKKQQHPLYGYRILSLFDDTLDIAEYVYSHHEMWNGSGYPKGIRGEQIPLISRIISVAEAYDRIIHTQRLPIEDREQAAAQYLRDGTGTRFAPRVAETFIHMIESGMIPR